MFTKIITCFGIFILVTAFDFRHIYENANIWYKVSDDPLSPGKIVALDMDRGYSECNSETIFIVMNEVETGDEIVVVFPNGGYWSAPSVDSMSVEIQKHFGQLEKDLRK